MDSINKKLGFANPKPVNLIAEALIFSFSRLYLMFFSYFCSSFTRTHLFVRWK